MFSIGIACNGRRLAEGGAKIIFPAKKSTFCLQLALLQGNATLLANCLLSGVYAISMQYFAPPIRY